MPIDSLPDIGDKPDGFGLAVPVAVRQIIRLNLCIQDRDGFREEIVPKSTQQIGEYLPVESEDDKTNVAKNKLLGATLRAALCCSDQATLFGKRDGRVALSEFSVSCSAQDLLRGA